MKDLVIFVILLSSLVKFPGGLHELNEVVVVINGGGDGGVVLVPLGTLDFAIAVLVTEAVKELQEDLVLGHLAGLDLGVHGAVVDATEIGGGDFTRAVSVELKESLVDHGLTLGVQGSLRS